MGPFAGVVGTVCVQRSAVASLVQMLKEASLRATTSLLRSAVRLGLTYWSVSLVRRRSAPSGYDISQSWSGALERSSALRSTARSSSHARPVPASGGPMLTVRSAPVCVFTNTTCPVAFSPNMPPRTAIVVPFGDQAGAKAWPTAATKKPCGARRVATTRSLLPSLAAMTSSV